MQQVSVIVVSWNTCNFLRQCLGSIVHGSSTRVCEIIVVDNASSDGSAEMVEREFPQVTLIRAGSNLGFARANNLAMQRARGSLLALVNSDAMAHAGCLDILAEFLARHPDVGLVGPRVNGGDGELQRTCRRLPTLWNTACRTLALDRLFASNRMFSGYEMTPDEHASGRNVEVLSGCFCVARRAAVAEVGGLDEQFFFYGEDIDWCKRLSDAGWDLMYVPEATATHFGGGSTSNAPLRYSIEILRATLKYWRKHHGRGGQWLCRALLVAHHGLRLSIRTMHRCLGLGTSAESRHKLHEDAVCLRWLFTGTAIPALGIKSRSEDRP